MPLPKRLFGGVDAAAAEAAVAEQRRMVAQLTEHLARVESQLEAVRRERDAADARARELESQVTDVLRLATRAAQDTEAEATARVAEATSLAQLRVDELASQAAEAADTAATLAAALQDAVARYRELVPIVVDPPEFGVREGQPSVGTPAFDAHWGLSTPEAVPEEPFVEPNPIFEAEVEPDPIVASVQPFTEPGAAEAAEAGTVVEPAEPPTPQPAEQPPAYTTVVARPLPSPAAAVDVEQRLVGLPGVREVTLQKLGSTEAEFTVAHDPGTLDLTPLTRLGVPVAVAV